MGEEIRKTTVYFRGELIPVVDGLTDAHSADLAVIVRAAVWEFAKLSDSQQRVAIHFAYKVKGCAKRADSIVGETSKELLTRIDATVA